MNWRQFIGQLVDKISPEVYLIAACPTRVMRSRWPRALTRSTQKPLSELWKVTRSTRPARTSVELTVDICVILAMMDAELVRRQNSRS